MSNSFENFTIRRLIVHEVYRREEIGEIQPSLNNNLCILDGNAIRELQTRIIGAIGHDSHSIEMDVVHASEGSVFALVKPFFTETKSDHDFVEMTKCITTSLSRAQDLRTIPGGVVLIFEGTIGADSGKCIGIIKAEKHGGFTLEINNQERLLRYINNLLLTPQQKLYKIALMLDKLVGQNNERLPENVAVYIFDSNNDKAQSKSAANYFYDGFMGCAFQRKSEVITRDFFNYTKEFVTKKSGLPGHRVFEVMSALYVYLKVNNSPNINVGEFGQQYLTDTNMRDNYSRFMETKRLPQNNIRKDLSLIASKLRQRKIRFTNNVLLYAPIDNFNNNIEIFERAEDHTIMKINGSIETES